MHKRNVQTKEHLYEVLSCIKPRPIHIAIYKEQKVKEGGKDDKG